MLTLLFISDASLRPMKIAQKNKALLIYRLILVNVDNTQTSRSGESKPEPDTPFEKVLSGAIANSKRRQFVDLTFHFICILAGFEYAMIFTNWTTIPDNQFTSNDIVDTKTIWVRFAGSLFGLVYLVVTCVNSYLGAKKKALKRMEKTF